MSWICYPGASRRREWLQMTNGVMMQYFHWYTPADGLLWNEVSSRATELAAAGITGVWLPPSYKGTGGGYDVGYGVYDMYDLGEFDQKGSVRTKYGAREEYLAAVKAIQSAGIQVYADAALNQRMGGDATELARATPFAQEDRRQPTGATREIRAYTRFTFPGRKGKYSPFEWRARHFDAVDYEERNPGESAIYLLEGKSFDSEVALEKGNFAFLMGCDLDFDSAGVSDEVTAWGKWYLDTAGVDEFRIDAVKHISAWFFPQWLDEMKRRAGKDLFAVGEYWAADVGALEWYLERLGGRMSVYDVPLHYHFHHASRAGGGYATPQLLERTLMQRREPEALPFVENLDSHPPPSLE